MSCLARENELLRAQAIVDAAEIDRMRDELKQLQKTLFDLKIDLIRENHVEYDKGWKDCATSIYHNVSLILGVST